MIQDIFQVFIGSFSIDPIAQCVWIIALFVFLFWYAQKNDNKALYIVLLSLVFWALHFYLLGIYSACIAIIISIFRIWLSVQFKKNKIVYCLVLLAVSIAWYISYDGIVSLLPITASFIGAYAYFFHNKILLRLLMFICSILWFVHNYIVWSIPGIINEILALIIMASTIYRLTTFEGKLSYYREKVLDTILQNPKIDFWRHTALKYYTKWKK